MERPYLSQNLNQIRQNPLFQDLNFKKRFLQQNTKRIKKCHDHKYPLRWVFFYSKSVLNLLENHYNQRAIFQIILSRNVKRTTTTSYTNHRLTASYSGRCWSREDPYTHRASLSHDPKPWNYSRVNSLCDIYQQSSARNARTTRIETLSKSSGQFQSLSTSGNAGSWYVPFDWRFFLAPIYR